MSTLAEIEAAADALPLDEKKKLLEFLASRTPTRMAAARARRVGMTELLDTNVALYLLGGRLVAPFPAGTYVSTRSIE